MSTDTLEDTTVDTTTGEKDPEWSHYYSKADLELIFLEHKPIRALCGHTSIPTRDGTRYPPCPTCVEIHRRLKQ